MDTSECTNCSTKVYAIEKVEANGRIYHKNCFRCVEDSCRLTIQNFHYHSGQLYCRKHVPKLQAVVINAIKEGQSISA